VKPEFNQDILQPEMQDKVQKFLRPIHTPPFESGMVIPYNTTPIDSLPSYNNDVIDMHHEMSYNPSPYIMTGNNNVIFDEKNRYVPRVNFNISCIDVATHVKYCMVCSKLYKQDHTIYIIVIIFLLLICLILLKNVLHV